jgi:dephospho-CoA kinase
MIVELILLIYLILCFLSLVIISTALPRITKLDKNKPFYIYIGYYVVNSLLLNFIFNFSPIKTIFLNFILLVLSHFIGGKFRLMGLTGQICCGKSTVAKYLQDKYKATVIDIDKLNREVLELPEVKKEIKGKFGDEIYDSTGEILDKLKLKKIIFADVNKRRQLEAVTHGKVFKMFIWRVLKEKFLYNNKFVFIENALLLRFKIFKYLCYPILAICTTLQAEIIGRVMQRDNCDRQTAENILASQLRTDEFVKECDFVVFNDGDKKALFQEVDKLMAQLM